MDQSLANIKSIEQKTLKLSNYYPDNDKAANGELAIENSENKWGVGILKSIVNAPFNMFNSKKSLKTENNNLIPNMRKN